MIKRLTNIYKAVFTKMKRMVRIILCPSDVSISSSRDKDYLWLYQRFADHPAYPP
jgi:lipocalin